ncbi:MAG: polysaccharide biosynthesis protein, partial [Gordonia sp. (in: high G+C Gram-positive bacteria)]
MSVRDRLVVNAGALMASSAATGALGLVYWIFAGRLFDASDVGRASALISTATMLSSLACLSLGGAYERFLPLAGDRTSVAVGGGFLVSGVAALLFGAVFAWLPMADKLLHTTGQRLAFPLMVAVFTAFALSDPILTGLRRAPAVAAKNIAFSVSKVVPLWFLSAGAAATGIVVSWTACALLCAVYFTVSSIRTAMTRTGRSQLPAPREL